MDGQLCSLFCSFVLFYRENERTLFLPRRISLPWVISVVYIIDIIISLIYILLYVSIYRVNTFFETIGTIETKGTIAKSVSAVVCYQWYYQQSLSETSLSSLLFVHPSNSIGKMDGWTTLCFVEEVAYWWRTLVAQLLGDLLEYFELLAHGTRKLRTLLGMTLWKRVYGYSKRYPWDCMVTTTFCVRRYSKRYL